MILSEKCIQRPVLTIMIAAGIVLLGFVGINRLPVRELPDIDPPIVNITTVYPGASAQVVETEVTENLEDAINTAEGIEKITSESREEVSSITVEFSLSREIDIAAQDVRDRVSRVRGELPDDIEEPVVAKQDGDANPFLWVPIYGEGYSTLELSLFAENTLQEPLQTVEGVSSVILGGEKRFSMRIWLDSQKMAARGITVLDVERALRSQNLQLPSGEVQNTARQLSIETLGELRTPEEFNRLVIREAGDSLIRLEDIGYAEIGVEDYDSRARYNGQPAVGLGIVKQSTANTIEVAKGIKEELARLEPLIPDDITYRIAYDESDYVEKSIRDVWMTLGIAFCLVIFSLFFFLRNVRSTIIPTITIPVAIIGTFAVLLAFGFSINILTLMALILTIGIVVDDTIIVLENIFRHIEEGMPPMKAAFTGIREIAFAVIATTISLVVVVTPMAFQTSVTGRLFIEFAMAIAGSVVISSFIALTLAPMLCARVLKPVHDKKHGFLFNAIEKFFNGVDRRYEKTLKWALNHRVLTMLVGVAAIGGGLFFLSRLEQDFLPDEDKSRLFSFILAPEGATSEYTDRMVRQVEEIMNNTPEVEGYFSAVALARQGPGQPNQGLMFVRFKDRSERERSVQDMLDGPTGLQAQYWMNVEGALAFPILPKAIGGGFTQPYQLVLQSQDLGRLAEVSDGILNKLRQEGFLQNPRNTFQLTKPQLQIEIRRDRAATLGVTVQDISRTLQILFGGQDLSTVKREGKEYDVVVQLERESRLTPSDIHRLYIRNDQGRLIQLSNVVELKETGAPNAIPHYNRFRSATIEGTPVGVTLGQAIERTEEILAEELPAGFRYEWSGEAEDLKDTGNEVLIVFIFALIAVYMVLGAQFESFFHPLTILVSVAMAGLGAFGSLWLLNQVNEFAVGLYGWVNYAPEPAPDWAVLLEKIIPRLPAMNMNLFSQIGTVLLVALVTKNGILLVEFANQAMARGKNSIDAMLEAGKVRLRPILMTSFSTIMGIMPIVIGFGVGAESRRPLGVVTVGGMISSTFLTLIVVPVVYTFMADLAQKLGSRRHAPKSSPGDEAETTQGDAEPEPAG